MEIFIKKKYKSELISSIILIVLGLLLVFESVDTIITISYIIGSLIIAMGTLAFINYFTSSDSYNRLSIAYGLVCIILGILIITNPVAIASIIPVIIGIGIIINSAIKLQYSLELKKISNKMWKTTMIVSLISTICGVIILFNPFQGAVIITKIIGIFLILYALIDGICAYKLKRDIKNVNAQIDVSIYDAKVVKEKKNKKK